MYKNKITIEEHKFMDLSRHVCDILTSSQKIFFNRRSLFFFNKLMTKFFRKKLEHGVKRNTGRVRQEKSISL